MPLLPGHGTSQAPNVYPVLWCPRSGPIINLLRPRHGGTTRGTVALLLLSIRAGDRTADCYAHATRRESRASPTRSADRHRSPSIRLGRRAPGRRTGGAMPLGRRELPDCHLPSQCMGSPFNLRDITQALQPWHLFICVKKLAAPTTPPPHRVAIFVMCRHPIPA